MSDATQLTAFEYEPFDPRIPGKCIRLLHLLPQAVDGVIRCTLENNVSISEGLGLSYTCLSYEWGDKFDTCMIEVDGRCVHIPQNLVNFLTSLLHQHAATGLKGLWIDAICINQGDEREKSQQVTQMHDIFRNASEVFSWLGPSAQDSDELFDFLNRVDIPAQEEISDADAIKSLEPKAWYYPQHFLFEAGFRLHCALKNLCSRTYWKRMWIVQEILLARKVHLVCGSKRTRWLHFAIILEGLMNQHAMFVHLQWIIGGSPVQSILQYWIHCSEGAAPEDVQTLLAKFGTFHCSEPRDKVYALRSLVSDSALIHVSYESPIEDVLLKLLGIFRRKMLYVQFSELCQMFGIKPWKLFTIFKKKHPSGRISKVKSIFRRTQDGHTVYTNFSLNLGRISFGGSQHCGTLVYTWEKLMELSGIGRLKKCNCPTCQQGWQAYGRNLSASSTNLSQQLNCERDRFDMADSLGVIFFYQRQMKDGKDVLAPFATGIVLREDDAISVLSNWDYDHVFDENRGRLYILLYHDSEMTQQKHGTPVYYTMSQLLNLIAHQYPGISSGDEEDAHLPLGPRWKELRTLRNVSIEGKMSR